MVVALLNSIPDIMKAEQQKLLLAGTIIAQLVHGGAMHTPWLGDVLCASPITFEQWRMLPGLALSVMVVMELQKWVRARFVIQTGS